ncbi:MAG TPA: hypothetical protein VM261_07790 [Kofleriaceae bacterium]|nr:hypothetical protein [Kofleriaceae bacterium]
MRAGIVAIALFAAACGEPKREAQPAITEPGGGTAPTGSGTGTGSDTEPRTDTEPGTGTGSDTEPGPAPDSFGSIPAWQAVVDRDRYLLRRGQQAVLSGRIGGEAIAPGARGVVRWLVDETEGNGSLGVRVALTGSKPPAEGDRVAVAGAWTLDDQRRWYWQVTSLSPLVDPAPPAPPDPPPTAPSHTIGVGSPPSGWKPISKARDGGIVTFGVIRTPTGEGDGWLVGDDSFGAPFAYLYLPGERSSYGGHDLRHSDERWVLKRGVTYWVRIDKIRRRTPEDLARIKATTAPTKF